MTNQGQGVEDKRQLRVLHLATHTGIAGGMAVQMARMVLGLRARGHHVVCGFNWRDFRAGVGERNFEYLERHGMPCVTFRMESFLSSVLGDRRRFRAFVAKHDFDIVHTYKPRALRWVLTTLGDVDKPIILAHHGNSYPLDDNARRLFGDPRVRAVLCMAGQIRQTTIDGGIDAAKVVTMYGGVNPEEFDSTIDPAPVRREIGIAEDAPVVGIIANFDGKKAYNEFFKAAALLARRVPEVRILVVGRGAPPDLPDKLRELGISDHVILAGFRQDVPRMLAAMDVSVNFSNRGEGLTGVMYESLCMKKPVVCTDIGGNRELVRDGETGRLVPPNDAPAFVDAIAELLSDPVGAKAMAEAGYRLVQEQFTEQVAINRLEQLYRKVLS